MWISDDGDDDVEAVVTSSHRTESKFQAALIFQFDYEKKHFWKTSSQIFFRGCIITFKVTSSFLLQEL